MTKINNLMYYYSCITAVLSSLNYENKQIFDNVFKIIILCWRINRICLVFEIKAIKQNQK